MFIVLLLLLLFLLLFTADEKKIEDDKEIQQDVNLTVKFHLTPDKVKSVTFPTYAPPNVKDDMVSYSNLQEFNGINCMLQLISLRTFSHIT